MGARWRWVVRTTPRPLYSQNKDPVPIVHEAGWAPGPVWTGAENPPRTGIETQDRPARSESQYRPSCPGPWFRKGIWKLRVLSCGVERGTCPLYRGEESGTRVLLNCQGTQRWTEKFTEKKWLRINAGIEFNKIMKSTKSSEKCKRVFIYDVRLAVSWSTRREIDEN